MNERIQALAVEAEDYADSIVDQGGEFHEEYTRKLAELIVKETLQVARAGIEFGDGMENAVYKYFGVEQ